MKLATTPDYTINAFFQPNKQGMQFRPFMNYSENKSYQITTQPSQRSAFQATAATVEQKECSPKIMEKAETKSDDGLTSSRILKPEVARMHSEIMSLQEKIKQLEEQITDKSTKPPSGPLKSSALSKT